MQQSINKKKENTHSHLKILKEEEEFSSSKETLSKQSSENSIESDESVIKSLENEESSENSSEDKESLTDNENGSTSEYEVSSIKSNSGSNVSLVFKTDRLVFFSVLNHVVSSILTIYNNGTTAIHFEWKKVQRNNDITKVY